ncbi:MAG: hypothetical protein HQL31_13595, partial [Planctomycetes bacterium]|nr:hypothetical protein [Planctomycetota bacterium]
MILSLSRRIQQKAQKLLVRLSTTNAVGFGFTIGQVVYLLALLYGADDTQMGLLYAAPFTTALAVLFVPVLLNGRETTAIWSSFWWLRAALCLSYFGLPWIAAAHTRVWVFILIYYLFMSARAIGMAGYYPVFKALAAPREQPSMMARTLMFGQFGVLFAQVVSFLILTFNATGSEEHNLYLLLGIGMVFNALTAALIGRLPRTGYLDEGGMRNLFRTAKVMLRRPEYREVAVLTALQAAMSVFAGYLISYLRNIENFSGGEIFMFTVVGLLGAIAIANMQRIVGRHIRSRVMLFVSHGVLALLGLVGALVPLQPALVGNRWIIALIYGITAIGLTASTTVVLQLRTGRLPDRNPVEFSICFDMAQALGAVVAILCVRFVAVPLVAQFSQLHTYSPAFLLWTLTCLGVCLLTLLMTPENSGGFRQELTALLPSNLFTIFRAHRLDRDDNFVRRQLALEGLLQNPGQVSRELILENLRSPDNGVRKT